MLQKNNHFLTNFIDNQPRIIDNKSENAKLTDGNQIRRQHPDELINKISYEEINQATGRCQ